MSRRPAPTAHLIYVTQRAKRWHLRVVSEQAEISVYCDTTADFERELHKAANLIVNSENNHVK